MKTLKITIAILAITLIASAACKKDDQKPNLETDIVTDVEGNSYKTVKIGDQWWMAENLKTTKYRNGDPIPNVTSNVEWSALTTAAYSCYNNDFATYGEVYGMFYNWYAVADSRNIAPLGWHVPTDAEWETMNSYLGGGSVAGGKLKEDGTSHWTSPNSGATNTSGFTALGTGSRAGSTGICSWIGLGNDYWSSTEANLTYSWTHYVGYDIAKCMRLSHEKRDGYCIRCVKD